ncbi:MAG TPA: VTT domain-containing protein [Acidobacteriaceae bacterium]|nr:VTT domain-containing protein [Acidobacteriaceae bacterium]
MALSLLSRAPQFALASAVPAAAHHHPSNSLIHLLLSFGILGVLLVSIVDSSFVPLPVPGITDIMVVVLAAQHANLLLLVSAATVGSFLGGYFSYRIGQSGGLAFLEKHVPPRIFKRVCSWMENHALLSVALPAILPPPMPLSPFVLAAGALKMSRYKFLTTFTLSRLLRHAVAAWLGIHYGRSVIRMWNVFTHRWGVSILIAIWSIILVSVGIAFWKLYRTSRAVAATGKDRGAVVPPVQA